MKKHIASNKCGAVLLGARPFRVVLGKDDGLEREKPRFASEWLRHEARRFAPQGSM